MIETIMYAEPKSFSSITSGDETLEFVFSDKIPYTKLPFMGIDLSIPFLNNRVIKGIQYIKINDQVFEPTFSDYKISGMLAQNGDNFSFIYEGDYLKQITRKEGVDNYLFDLFYDNEGKLLEINSYISVNGGDFTIISQKQLIYSDNDIVIGFNEFSENHMFIFDNFDVINYTSNDGSKFTISYQ